MAAKKKRAKGGGRKPAGPFGDKSASFTMRIQASTRASLEATRPRRPKPWSLSQWTEKIMLEGLAEHARCQQPDAIRGLAHVLGYLASIIRGDSFTAVGPLDWQKNPFAARAFQLAIQQMMEGIAPKGEIVPPSEDERPMLGPCDSPDARARYASTIVLHLLQNAPPLERLSAIADDTPPPLSPGTKVGTREPDGSLTPFDLPARVPMSDAVREGLSNTQNAFAWTKSRLLPQRR
jgi:hypothetical protein